MLQPFLLFIALLLTCLAPLRVQAAGDPSTVLVLVNDAWPAETGTGGVGASVFVGEHYAQVRNIPSQNVLHLNIPMNRMQWLPTNDFMEYSDYLTYVQTPIQTYLAQQGLANKILYIVPTYGIPYMLQSIPGDPAKTWRLSLDAVLAGMNSGKTTTFAPNPYHTFSNTDAPLHIKDWINPAGWKMYLVTRLDGPTPLIAAGLADKAVASENTLTKSDGKAYFDWEHRTSPSDPYKSTDDTIKNAYDLSVSVGIPSILNDQSISQHMFSPASGFQYSGNSISIFSEGISTVTARFVLPNSTASGTFHTSLQFNRATGVSGAGFSLFRLYSADRQKYWELRYPWPGWTISNVVLSKVIDGTSIAACSVKVSTQPLATSLSFTFSDTSGEVFKNGSSVCSLTDPSAQKIDVTQGEAVFGDMSAEWNEVSVQNSSSQLLWSDSFTADTTSNYTWITMPKEAQNALFIWGWYSFVNDAYTVVPGAVGTQMTSYTANYIRSAGVPNVDGQWVPYFLRLGITATWGATGEPYTNGYANGDNLLGHFWRGYNFGESAYLASPFLNWMMVFIGDPLYGPSVFNGGVSAYQPPAISRQPVDTTVSVGEKALFSVEATGTAPLSYQWFRNGLPIQGATAATYAIDITGDSDNQALFYVVINNITNQPATSTPARLTVTTLPVTPAPTITPNGGNFVNAVTVTLADSDPNAALYYALINGGPTAVYLRYTSPITISASGTFQFYAVAPGKSPSATSRAIFGVTPSVQIIQQPFDQMVNVGESATFSVQAIGSQPLSYQWYKNDTAIQGASRAAYTTPAALLSDDNSQYYVTVNDALNVPQKSGTAVLHLSSEPSIRPPLISPPGGTFEGSVDIMLTSLTPGAQVFYTLDGSAPSKASTLYEASFTLTQSGALRTVSVLAGQQSAESYAFFTISAPLQITQQPTDQTATVGQTATFTVNASGNSALTINWHREGSDAVLGLGNSYTTPPTTLADEGAKFYAIIVDIVGQSVTSNSATLHVSPLFTTAVPSINPNGGSFTSSVQVSMADTTQGAKIYYTTDGSAPANGSTIYLAPFMLTANSTVRAIATISGFNNSPEASAVFTINQPPMITQQPVDQSVSVGQTGVFSVTSSGTGPLSYQWSKNGQPIPGATASIYTTPPVVLNDDGSIYRVVVSNFTGIPATSNPAILHVNALSTVATPSISPLSGTFFGSVHISITDATQDAQIYFTTDGSAPSLTSTPYATPFSLTTSSTIRAIAAKAGMNTSAEAQASFLNHVPIPDVSGINGKTFSPRDALTLTPSTYASGYNWQFQNIKGDSALGIRSLRAATGFASTIETAAPQLSLGTLPLTTGSYTVRVQAMEGTQLSEWSEPATFALVESDLSAVHVFPNPWRSSRGDGGITFDQLASASTIKIFTVSGHWVKTLKAPSGIATWDLQTDAGEKAASGLYLFLITDAQDNKTRGKFVIIR